MKLTGDYIEIIDQFPLKIELNPEVMWLKGNKWGIDSTVEEHSDYIILMSPNTHFQYNWFKHHKKNWYRITGELGADTLSLIYRWYEITIQLPTPDESSISYPFVDDPDDYHEDPPMIDVTLVAFRGAAEGLAYYEDNTIFLNIGLSYFHTHSKYGPDPDSYLDYYHRIPNEHAMNIRVRSLWTGKDPISLYDQLMFNYVVGHIGFHTRTIPHEDRIRIMNEFISLPHKDRLMFNL